MLSAQNERMVPSHATRNGKPAPRLTSNIWSGSSPILVRVGRVTIASTEFKVLSSLKNVKRVPKHVGVMMQNFRRYSRCIVMQSWYKTFNAKELQYN